MERIWYEDSPSARASRLVLAPASLLFSAAASLRTMLYDRGVLGAQAAPAPVVSVGGLTVGGVGKTPFVLWLAQRLREVGLRPCIVTGGYGGSDAGRPPFLLSAAAAGDPEAAARFGDEAVLLALRSGGDVAVGRERLAACKLAARELAAKGCAPDLFLLDDGFQHRRLARDLDVVLVSGAEGSQCVLPAGPLRERRPALSRADVVVVMNPDPLADLPTGGAAAGPLYLHATTRPAALVRAVTDADGENLSALDGRRVAAVAAIARPSRFLADLERAGACVVATVLRRDHHRYDAADCREIESLAASVDLVVTTEKDLVKLAHARFTVPLRALRIEVEVEHAAPRSDEAAGPEASLLERVRSLVAFDR